MNRQEPTTLEFIKMKLNKIKLKKIDWFQKKHQVNQRELSIDEMIKYEELKKHQTMFSISLFIYPLYLLFWAGLYSIVYKIAFGIDMSDIFLLVVTLIGRYWLHAIVLLLIVVELPSQLSKSRFNRRLVDKMIKERRTSKPLRPGDKNGK